MKKTWIKDRDHHPQLTNIVNCVSTCVIVCQYMCYYVSVHVPHTDTLYRHMCQNSTMYVTSHLSTYVSQLKIVDKFQILEKCWRNEKDKQGTLLHCQIDVHTTYFRKYFRDLNSSCLIDHVSSRSCLIMFMFNHVHV